MSASQEFRRRKVVGRQRADSSARSLPASNYFGGDLIHEQIEEDRAG
jgi:hypothetical protein